MNTSATAWFSVLGTIVFTVYGQLVLKWQVSKVDEISLNAAGWSTLVRLFANPWVLSGFIAAAVAAVCWLAALSRLDLSVAYPFMATSFVAVLISSAIFFGESITTGKVLTVGFIVAGLVIGSVR